MGYGLLAEVPALLGPGVQRVALLHPPTMIKTAERLSHELSAAGLEPVRVDLPDGEAARASRLQNDAGRFLAMPVSPDPMRWSASAVARRPIWRVRGCYLAPGARVIMGADHPARHGGRGGGREDRVQYRGRQEPGRLLL